MPTVPLVKYTGGYAPAAPQKKAPQVPLVRYTGGYAPQPAPDYAYPIAPAPAPRPQVPVVQYTGGYAPQPQVPLVQYTGGYAAATYPVLAQTGQGNRPVAAVPPPAPPVPAPRPPGRGQPVEVGVSIPTYPEEPALLPGRGGMGPRPMPPEPGPEPGKALVSGIRPPLTISQFQAMVEAGKPQPMRGLTTAEFQQMVGGKPETVLSAGPSLAGSTFGETVTTLAEILAPGPTTLISPYSRGAKQIERELGFNPQREVLDAFSRVPENVKKALAEANAGLVRGAVAGETPQKAYWNWLLRGPGVAALAALEPFWEPFLQGPGRLWGAFRSQQTETIRNRKQLLERKMEELGLTQEQTDLLRSMLAQQSFDPSQAFAPKPAILPQELRGKGLEEVFWARPELSLEDLGTQVRLGKDSFLKLHPAEQIAVSFGLMALDPVFLLSKFTVLARETMAAAKLGKRLFVPTGQTLQDVSVALARGEGLLEPALLPTLRKAPGVGKLFHLTAEGRATLAFQESGAVMTEWLGLANSSAERLRLAQAIREFDNPATKKAAILTLTEFGLAPHTATVPEINLIGSGKVGSTIFSPLESGSGLVTRAVMSEMLQTPGQVVRFGNLMELTQNLDKKVATEATGKLFGWMQTAAMKATGGPEKVTLTGKALRGWGSIQGFYATYFHIGLNPGVGMRNLENNVASLAVDHMLTTVPKGFYTETWGKPIESIRRGLGGRDIDVLRQTGVRKFLPGFAVNEWAENWASQVAVYKGIDTIMSKYGYSGLAYDDIVRALATEADPEVANALESLFRSSVRPDQLEAGALALKGGKRWQIISSEWAGPLSEAGMLHRANRLLAKSGDDVTTFNRLANELENEIWAKTAPRAVEPIAAGTPESDLITQLREWAADLGLTPAERLAAEDSLSRRIQAQRRQVSIATARAGETVSAIPDEQLRHQMTLRLEQMLKDKAAEGEATGKYLRDLVAKIKAEGGGEAWEVYAYHETRDHLWTTWRTRWQDSFDKLRLETEAVIGRPVTANPPPPRAPVAAPRPDFPPGTTADKLDPTALREYGWTRGQKGLLAAVNADRRASGLAPYANLGEIPVDEALASIDKRIRGAAPAAPEIPAEMPPISPNRQYVPSDAIPPTASDIRAMRAPIEVQRLREWVKAQSQLFGQFTDVTPQQAAVIDKGVKQAKGRLAEVRTLAERFGTMAMRDYALHNYPARYNFDTILGVGYGYPFWYTRTYAKWATKALTNPYALEAVYMLETRLEDMNQDLPFWAKKNLTLRDVFGNDLITTNILAQVIPIHNLLDGAFYDADRNRTKFGPVYETMYGYGPGPHALIPELIATYYWGKGNYEQALAYTGYLGGSTRTVNALTVLLRELGVEAIPPGGLAPEMLLPGPWQLMVGRGKDGRAIWLGTKWDQRRLGQVLAEMAREGTITMEHAQDVGLVASDPQRWLKEPALERAYETLEKAVQRSREREVLSDLISWAGGPGLRFRGEYQIEVFRMDQAVREILAKGDDPNYDRQKLSQEMAEFTAQHPDYIVVSLFRKRGNQRLRAYAWSVLSRLQPGPAAAKLREQAGLSRELLDRWYESGGQVPQGIDRNAFEAGIVSLGVLLELPTLPTVKEWKTATTARSQLYEQMSLLYPGTEEKADHYYWLLGIDDGLAEKFMQENPELQARLQTESEAVVADPVLAPYYATYTTIERWMKGEFSDEQEAKRPGVTELYAEYLKVVDATGGYNSKLAKAFYEQYELKDYYQAYKDFKKGLDEDIRAYALDIIEENALIWPEVRKDITATPTSILDEALRTFLEDQAPLVKQKAPQVRPKLTEPIEPPEGPVVQYTGGYVPQIKPKPIKPIKPTEIEPPEGEAVTPGVHSGLAEQFILEEGRKQEEQQALEEKKNGYLTTTNRDVYEMTLYTAIMQHPDVKGDPVKAAEYLEAVYPGGWAVHASLNSPLELVAYADGRDIREAILTDTTARPAQWIAVIAYLRTLTREQAEALKQVPGITWAWEHAQLWDDGPSEAARADIVGIKVNFNVDGSVTLSRQTPKQYFGLQALTGGTGGTGGATRKDAISVNSDGTVSFGEQVTSADIAEFSEMLAEQQWPGVLKSRTQYMTLAINDPAAAIALWQANPQLAEYDALRDELYRRYNIALRGAPTGLAPGGAAVGGYVGTSRVGGGPGVRTPIARAPTVSQGGGGGGRAVGVGTPTYPTRVSAPAPAAAPDQTAILLGEWEQLAQELAATPGLYVLLQDYFAVGDLSRQTMLKKHPNLALYISRLAPEKLMSLERAYFAWALATGRLSSARATSMSKRNPNIMPILRVYGARSGRTGLLS